MTLDWPKIEAKWQNEWFQAGLGKARRRPGQKKFFLIFAYPGVSGFLHVGHMRGYTYADVLTRFRRMQGYNVLFPAGFHASGLPAPAYAAKVRKKDPATIAQLQSYGLSDAQIRELETPENTVKFYSRVYVEDFWKKFGFLIDYDRLISTIQPEYNSFIQWQFRKLKEKNLLVQKPHFAPQCPADGPVAIDSAETDIACGGNAETLEYTLLKFQTGEYILPAATLRPETVWGVTNLWLNPGVDLEIVEVNNEKWLMSPEAARTIVHQKPHAQPTGQKIRAESLIGQTCFNPVVKNNVPILPGAFVDANIGTGVVMSVPAHAPFDWMALKEIQKNPAGLTQKKIPADLIQNIQPISLISSPGYGEFPAVEECQKRGIEKLSQDDLLEQATQAVYKAEFHSGKLKAIYGELAGESVAQVKAKLIERFSSQGISDSFYGFSEKVVCRCGRDVVIALVPDQWFIRYSDEKLTADSIEQAKAMNIWPEQYHEQLPGVLEWFKDRACVRQGSWLGTRFPFDEKWIIEPISDSTLYPLVYLISPYINEKKLRAEQLTEVFFDFVFLGRGDLNVVAQQAKIDARLLAEIREDFLYWYPLDVNLGGKEHKTVHFPVFLMNHVGVLDPKSWPRGIFVNWWVTGTSGKISKSKGGAMALHDLTTRFSTDALRLYYCNTGSPHADIEFREEDIEKYRQTLDRIVIALEKMKSMEKNESHGVIDAWLAEKSARLFSDAETALEEGQLREYSELLYYQMPLDLKWYISRGGSNNLLLEKLAENWIRTLTPITPHLAEEMWHSVLKQKTLVSNERWPKFEGGGHPAALQAEELVTGLIADVEKIMGVAKIAAPKKITVYPAAAWKWNALELVLKSFGDKPDFKAAMGAWMADVEMKKHAPEAAQFVQKIAKDPSAWRNLVPLDEARILESEKNWLEKKFNCSFFIDANGANEKASKAMPAKPAIHIE